MGLTIAITLSVILQFGAFIITISLIPKTKLKIAWITISIGFFLMTAKRLFESWEIMTQVESCSKLNFNCWLSVSISALMFIASFYIRQILLLLEKVERIRKNNEAKVLTAIIKTEEKDRKIFARELHDGIGPILSTIKMTISAIEKEDLVNNNKLIIEKTETAVDSAITTIKEISNNLSPHILERYGLEKAIIRFYDSNEMKNKPRLNIISKIELIGIDKDTEVVIYRIICELINNTLKHAKAYNIDISVGIIDSNLELLYADDGVGFDIAKLKNDGMGLANIQSRVISLNGNINFETSPNNGFIVKIYFEL